jgi:polygalacturonase
MDADARLLTQGISKVPPPGYPLTRTNLAKDKTMRKLQRNPVTLAFLTLISLSIFIANNRACAATWDENFTVNPALPQIPDRAFNLKDFGGVGDGKTFNTDAFHKAIAEIDHQGGGRLVVPAGVYRTLPFVLCSRLDLHLDEGAVIAAPDTFAGYDIPDPTTLANQAEVRAKVKMPDSLISGRNLHDVAITGTGIIDGGGAVWWAWSERPARAQPGRLIYPRQKMVVIAGCERLHVEGITFRNSPQFHFVPRNVTDLLIERVKVIAPHDAPNTDAIDPSVCSNMVIRDCDFDTGDDDIAIKSGGHNLLIENCRIKHGHGISIGSETTVGVHDMLVRHCTFDGADNGIRIKSMRGAGGLVENIRYTDIQMHNVANAIVLDLTYTDSNRPNFVGDPTKIPKMQHIQIDNVQIKNSKNAGKIVGLPDSHITDVSLHNVQITADHDLVIQNCDQLNLTDVQRSIGNPFRGSATQPN